jgi:class 3 adenylate cyclase/tetratricopeptide (TPR) repeat protein
MTICAACRHENPDRARFCLECGTRLSPGCAQCGTELPAGAKFCLECGHRVATPETAPAASAAPAVPAAPATAAAATDSRLASYTPKHLAEKILKSRSALEGERRQVTVLFADVAGFTTLAEQLDPEEVHSIIERCFELITAEVHRFEGTINQYTGDGVMALFGAPIAHEDAPRRAVHAALGIQRALGDFGKELEARGGPPVRMRIGLNTGPVVVGRIGDDLRMDYTAVGDTTNLAARMQHIARPGGVLVSEATHKAVAGFFETLDLGETPVKGHAPVRVFEILRPRGRRSRLDVAAERGLTPLIGRERELGVLRERFAEVKAGRGQLVLLVGDAGLGKSRLLLEFQRELSAQGEVVTWLVGECVSFGQTIPFLPLVDQLRRNFGIEELDGEPEIIAKVEHGMRRIGELEAHIPFIRFLLSVDPGDPTVAAMDPLLRRKKIFEAGRMLTVRGARRRPLVLVFEDLHWMDSSTEEYLGTLMDSIRGAPILLILTHRVGYAPPFGTRSFHTTLNLQPLSEAEVATMAGRVLGTGALPPELQAALMQKAEGVPLFIEEVTKTLLDLGVLRHENGGYRMAKGTAEMAVPDTMQGIIMARLDRLGENGKRTVQLASVIGRQFLVRLLQRIGDLRAEGLEGLLGELKALEIIYELGLLPEPAYIFKHAVIQDVAYNSLLVQRRKELHRAVGYAIEELYADRLADHYEELAHHFSQGEEWSKAFDYLLFSADRAKSAFANQAALDFYARAVVAAAKVVPPVPWQRLFGLHQRRADVYVLVTQYAEAQAEAGRMVALARAAGDRRAEAEAFTAMAWTHFVSFSWEAVQHTKESAEEAMRIAAEVGDQEVLAKSLHLLGIVDQTAGDLSEAKDKFEESLRIARAHGYKRVIAQAQSLLAAQTNWRGEFQEAIDLCRDTEAVAREVGDGFTEMFAMAFRCLAHIGHGEYVAGFETITEGLALAKDRDNAFILGRLGNSLGWLHQELGDFTRALEHDREAAELGRRIHNDNLEISSLVNLAFDHLHLGEPSRALTLMEQTLARAEKGFGSHRWRWRMHLFAYIAEALTALGRHGEALGQIDQALAIARATGSAKYIAKCRLLEGSIAAEAQQWGQAEARLAEALDIARDIGYPTLIWQSAHVLGRALRAQVESGRAEASGAERAWDMVRLAQDTIEGIAGRLPYPALSSIFLGWSRVQAVGEDLDRLRRG